MKSQRKIPICLLVLFLAAPAAAEKLCVKTARIVATYTLSFQTATKVRIEASSREGDHLYCLRNNCTGAYIATWNTACGSGKREGKVSSGRPVQWFAPMCQGGRTLVIMVTSGCIDLKVDYMTGF